MDYAEKVTDVLDYVQGHPQDVRGVQMSYEPLNRLDSSRLPDVVQGLAREDVFVGPDETPNNSGTINRPKPGKREEHMADVALAMLYLTCGGLDEAHDLVLPYSWPSPTDMGGPPIKNSAATQESRYCHALVHRREGQHIGEVGMQGWGNACFWFGMTEYHSLFPKVCSEAAKIALTYDEETREKVNGRLGKDRNCKWNPDAFTAVCREAVAAEDAELLKFCAEVANKEWRLLFDACNTIANGKKEELV